MNIDTIQTLAIYLLMAMGVSLLLAVVLLLLFVRRLRRIKIPAGAGFSETLRHTPFILALIIDLLDFALDFLAAPFAWVLLDRLGFKGLRGVSVVQALIPFTQPVPVMTLSWIFVRLFGARLQTD